MCDALLMKSSLGCGGVSRSRAVVSLGNVDADGQMSGRKVQVHTGQIHAEVRCDRWLRGDTVTAGALTNTGCQEKPVHTD